MPCWSAAGSEDHVCSLLVQELLRQIKYLWKWTRSKKEQLGGPRKRENRKTQERSWCAGHQLWSSQHLLHPSSHGEAQPRTGVPFPPLEDKIMCYLWQLFPPEGHGQPGTVSLQDTTLICNHQSRNIEIHSEGRQKAIQIVTEKSNNSF